MKMKSIDKFKSVLENIEITEDQKNALHEFFSEFSEVLKDKIRTEVYEEAKNEALEEVQKNYQESSEASVDAEKLLVEAKNIWEAEKDEEISKLKSSLEEAFTEELSVALEELYDTIEEKVKVDLLQTKEMKALGKIKDAVIDIVEDEDVRKLANEVQELKFEAEALKEFIGENKKKEIIEDLVSEFDDKSAKAIRAFLEDCKDEEEIYKTFDRVVTLFESKEEEDNESIFDEDDDFEDEDSDDEDFDSDESEDDEEEIEDEDESEEEEDEDDSDDLDEEEDEEEDDEQDEDEEEVAEEDEKYDTRSTRMFTEAEMSILKKAKIL